jgi:hypothetical protein
MNPGRALGVVGVGALAGGVLGAAIGWALGAFAPSAYASMFERGSDPSFNPVAVGVALGFPQGLAAGIVVSFLYLFWLKWSGSLSVPGAPAIVGTPEDGLRRLRRSVTWLWILVSTVLVLAAGVEAFRLVERGRGWYQVSCTRRGEELSFGQLGVCPPVIVTHVYALEEDKVGVLPRPTFVGPKCGAEVSVANVAWVDWMTGAKTTPPSEGAHLEPGYVFAEVHP